MREYRLARESLRELEPSQQTRQKGLRRTKITLDSTREGKLNRLLSTRQAAEVLGVRPKQVREYISEGKLQGTKLGGNGKSKRHWRIKLADLEAFVSGNTEAGLGHTVSRENDEEQVSVTSPASEL